MPIYIMHLQDKLHIKIISNNTSTIFQIQHPQLCSFYITDVSKSLSKRRIWMQHQRVWEMRFKPNVLKWKGCISLSQFHGWRSEMWYMLKFMMKVQQFYIVDSTIIWSHNLALWDLPQQWVKKDWSLSPNIIKIVIDFYNWCHANPLVP